MAWTTPKTDFADGNVLTAAQMNAIGNDLAFLHDSGGTLISTTTLSGSTNTITVPGGFKSIRLILKDFQVTSAARIGLRLNGVANNCLGQYQGGTPAAFQDTKNATITNWNEFLAGYDYENQTEIEIPFYDSPSRSKLVKAFSTGSGFLTTTSVLNSYAFSSVLNVQTAAAAVTSIEINAPTAANQATPTNSYGCTAYLIGY